jgi:nucleoside-diphosphate-sugar epimerase
MAKHDETTGVGRMDGMGARGAGSRELHVVLGAGQVGPRLARWLVERGHRVRVVRRSAADVPGVEVVRADLRDADAATAACEGADVIYDCTNPASYARWDELMPPLRRGVHAAVTRTGAHLVALDNLYMLEVPADGVLRESTKRAPRSRKGELRRRLEAELLEAVARRELSASIGRASDFFGPGAGAHSFFGERTIARMAAGGAALVVGDPKLPRSYSYVPDVVRGLGTLGERRPGGVFHLPVAWKTGSTLELVAAYAAELGRAPKTFRMPGWAFAVLGLFAPDLGAVREMLYQWQAPFVVDDSLFVETFGVEATPIGEAIAASVREVCADDA